MHDTDEKRTAEWADHCNDPDALEFLVDQVSFADNLGALIALACENVIGDELPAEIDPDQIRHPGALAAIRAYAAWKQAEGHNFPIEILRDGPEPEVLPLSLAGNWVAWSSDGLRIVASAKTIEEAERLAAEAGEPEPIMDHHPGSGRQL